MGTIAYYVGDNEIPEEKRSEFAQAIIKILREGGMMKVHKVSMFDKSIHLLSPVELDSNGEVQFYYNYFEEDSWETASFDASKAEVYSGKIGYLCFNRVMCACYRLYEYYTKSFGFAHANDICFDRKTIGWLNYLLHKKYSVVRPLRLLEIYRFYIKHKKEYGYCDEDCFYYTEEAGKKQIKAKEVIWSEYYNLLYVYGGLKKVHETFGIDDAELQTLPEKSYNRQLPILEKLIHELHNEYKWPLEKLLDVIDKIVNSVYDYNKLSQENKDIYLRLLSSIFWTTNEMLIKAIANEYKQDFWKLWDQTKHVFGDSEPDWMHKNVPSVPTRKFLCGSPYNVMAWGEKREREWYSAYNISDDHRLYYYDNARKFKFSSQLLDWLDMISKRYQNVLKNTNKIPLYTDYLRQFIDVCTSCASDDKGLYFFNDAFYEFINHSNSIQYWAAIELLKVLVTEVPKGQYHKSANFETFAEQQDDYYHDQRHKVKLFIALLANHKLRKKYLGF